jgi:L-alanine-DL-glutamate epimerase-like enolase superfamily enzyme
MAKAALEMALLDAELRIAGMTFGAYLGAVRGRVPAGVSVGIMASVPQLLDAVDAYLEQGYLRVKLKIQPGWDVEPVQAVRERFGDGLALQVDANTAYTLADARHLARLDPFDMLLIEQPLAEDDLAGHATLAKQLRTQSALTSRSRPPGPPPRPWPGAHVPSSTSKPGESVATWRPDGCTMCVRLQACRSGAAGCWRPGWAGRPT